MPSVDEQRLIDAWDGELTAIAALAGDASPEQWRGPTRLAGWSFADVVAHVVDIESIIAGDPRPEHTPDWAALVHVDDDIARFTEVGVDARRGMSREDLLAELADVHSRLAARLRSLPDDAQIASATGRLQPLARVLSMRCFDLWVHEQDLRAALDLPGGYESSACDVASLKALELARNAWQSLEPSPGVLTVRITSPTSARASYDFGGAGEPLALAGSLSAVLDIITGRAVEPDARWTALTVAP